MNSEYESTIRQIMQFLGATLVGHGYITQGDWQLYSGAIISIGTLAWSIYRTRQARIKAQATTQVAVTTELAKPEVHTETQAKDIVEAKVKQVLTGILTHR